MTSEHEDFKRVMTYFLIILSVLITMIFSLSVLDAKACINPYYKQEIEIPVCNIDSNGYVICDTWIYEIGD